MQKGNDDEDLCKFAIEFWCTICDEELNILDEIEFNLESHLPPPQRKIQYFVKGALQFLVPLLSQCLTLQEEDFDPDDYTIPMAAGVCLTLVAQTAKDDVVQYIMPFIERNILSTEWNLREAAVLSFGSILDGPKGIIKQLINQAALVLVKHLKDPVTAVKDTSAWTLGNIFKHHFSAVAQYSEVALKALCENLGDPSPRVSGKACFAIHNFALACTEEENSPISRHFIDVVKMLLLCADRQDSVQENLRTSAYEALNVVLDSAPPAADEALTQILKLMSERMEKTFSMELLNQDDQNNQNELQGLLCGVFQVLIIRLQKLAKPFADTIMMHVIRIFRSKKDSGVYEEAMLTANALIQVVESDFKRYMTDLLPHLVNGLMDVQSPQVCNIAVGVVGDIARALGNDMFPFCDKIITVLLQNLQNKDLDRTVKPTILSVFGDIALAIGGNLKILASRTTNVKTSC